MRTAVLSEDLQLQIAERDRPEPEDDEVLVRMRSVGICGSDVHYYEHGRIGDYVVDSPLVLGHESAGEVVEVGSAVDDLGVGDRVTLEPGVPCGRDDCEFCRANEYNLCPNVQFMATPPDDGAFAEYVAWPADYAYRLPESVSLRAGALIEPLSVGIHVCRRAGIGLGDAVYISGCGPIGLLAMEVARVAGAEPIVVADVLPSKLERARERGATVVNVAEENPVDAVEEATGGRFADVVVEASGAEQAIGGTLDVVRRGGTVVLVGLAADGVVPFDTNDIIDNELDLLGSFRYRHTYPTAIELLASEQVDVEGIIDFEMALDDVDEAFRRVQAGETVKGMISLG
ncbi:MULTISPECIES: NAD(P)-dependent alcohol dehydrogenase [Haloprofundus]|uniref:NAD(P)-dependent alcohol dehydrogenase n=1 Tax=Haloprofundus TaxID=1911573 RepID=UPI000E42F76A|nr:MULTISPECIES: NAD(P)-dependent alcohol dehydrogenase [Haloprofundus]QCJ47897.1 NAD(P)-dependent alcohol dehydrogenase [Haloprofundus sp. MHR1]